MQAWQKQLQRRRYLVDSEGRPVEIVYPGRLNDGRGGDFRDAVVNSGNICKSGCIEIHTRASSWQSHGHHLDPAYNQVVLHVAMEQGRPERTLLQNGQSIPTVILDQYIDREPQNNGVTRFLCEGIFSGPDALLEYLDWAGEQRFFSKAFRYQAEIAQMTEGQSLYQGVLEALGYNKNQKPFQELARRVPLHVLEKVIDTRGSEEDILNRLQALLLCSASTLDWELYKVRPDNLPARRIMALSHLIYRFRKQGWLPTLLDIIRQTPVNQARQELELAFIVAGDGVPLLLGRDRAIEIIINVFLPFVWSWSRRTSESELGRKILEIYHRYPRMESNSIERHMLGQLSLERRRVNSACRQQGLIYIYKTLCIQGKCQLCSFNSSKSLRSFSRS